MSQPTIGVYRMAHLLAALRVDDTPACEALEALRPLVVAALALLAEP